MLVSPRLAVGRRRLAVLGAACALWVVACAVLVAGGLATGPVLPLLVVGAALLGIAEGTHAPTADAVPGGAARAGRAVHGDAPVRVGRVSVLAPGLTAVLLSTGPVNLWLVLGGLSALAAVGYAIVEAAPAPRTGRVGQDVALVG